MGDRGRQRIFKQPTSSIRSFIELILHKIDLFAKPITLTYAKDPKFKSNIGGIWTIIVGLILFALCISELITLINKTNTVYSSIVNTEDIMKDTTLYNIGSDKYFNFAFSLVVNGVDLIADGTYVQVTLDQVTQTRTTSSGVTTTSLSTKSIPFSKWGTAFNFIDSSKASQLGINNYYWPSSTDYSIKGTYYSDEYIYIQLNVKRWSSGSCKTDSEITTKLTNARVQMALINSFVNFKEYSNALGYNIDDGNYWDLVPGYDKKTDIFVQRNYGNFLDGIMIYDDQASGYFYQIINTHDRFDVESSTDKILLQVYFRRDNEKIEYRRQTYSLIDALAKVGGIFKIVAAVIDIILLMFVENLFYTHMITRLYQLEDNHDRIYLTDTSDYEKENGQGTLNIHIIGDNFFSSVTENYI